MKFHQLCNVYLTIFILSAVDLLVGLSKLMFQNYSSLARYLCYHFPAILIH